MDDVLGAGAGLIAATPTIETRPDMAWIGLDAPRVARSFGEPLAAWLAAQGVDAELSGWSRYDARTTEPFARKK